MNYKEAIAKIEKDCNTILNREEVMKGLIAYATPYGEEFALLIIQVVKSLDYQKIIHKVKDEAIANIKKLENEDIDFEVVKFGMVNAAIKEISDEVSRANEEKEELKKLKEKEEVLQQGLSKLRATKLLAQCAQSSVQRKNKQKQTARSLSKKLPKEFQNLSNNLSQHKRNYDLWKYNTSSINNEAKEDITSKLQETIIEIIDLYKRCPNNSESYELVSRVFGIINSNIKDSIWQGFVTNNFSKIIEFGFKNEEFTTGLLQLVKEVSKINVKKGNSEDNYQYVLGQYKEVSDQLEKLKASCSNEGFNAFIDFIHSSKKEKEEQDRKEKLQIEKAERELLEEESKKTGTRPKQLQPKRKKKRSKNSSNSKTVIKDKKLDEFEAQSVKEEVFFEDKEVKALRGGLKELTALLFPDERSKQFEDEINKAIENSEKSLKIEASSINDEKIKDLYVIKSDFHLRRTILSISNYDKQYGKIIEQTKGDFGTNRFSPEHNKHITSHLTDIASRVQNIDTNLKEVLSVLDKMTLLVYKDYCQESDERCLKIISEENFKWLNRFLDYLKALEKWHSNKISCVQEYGIISGTKTEEERKKEKKALKAIKSCVGSLDTFISKSNYVQDLNNNQSVKSSSELPLKCYGPYQPWQYYGPHQQWCALSNVSIEKIHKLPEEVRSCSCYSTSQIK
ncbi:hypothetical protein [Candidatus Mesenet endosymbiont of Agriotes lineatus]|uniref:hypothetical protein n=1 Tax=Candidatus Mesenet endosymbiont of Agriotes lineatus TaxID=3077948 RepID=UPI0030D563DC